MSQRIPAWGVSVDLTPREIVQGRQTKVVQRLVVLGLVVVLLACGGLALLTRSDRADAQRTYDDAQSQTAALQSASHDFDGLVAVQQITQQSDAEAQTLLAQDVDFVNLMARVRAALPAEVTISNLTVVLAPPADAATAPTSSDSAAPADGADAATIGTVSITGGGTRIKALAPFVARLNHMKGISDVVPTSTTQTDTGMAYSLTMNFTGDLYSHRFDASTNAAANQ